MYDVPRPVRAVSDVGEETTTPRGAAISGIDIFQRKLVVDGGRLL